MGTNAGQFFHAQRERRVLVNVDLAELDKMAELMPAPQIVATGGFTIDDLVNTLGRPRSTIRDHLRVLLKAGKVKVIGRRPGRSADKVYQAV